MPIANILLVLQFSALQYNIYSHVPVLHQQPRPLVQHVPLDKQQSPACVKYPRLNTPKISAHTFTCKHFIKITHTY